MWRHQPHRWHQCRVFRQRILVFDRVEQQASCLLVIMGVFVSPFRTMAPMIDFPMHDQPLCMQEAPTLHVIITAGNSGVDRQALILVAEASYSSLEHLLLLLKSMQKTETNLHICSGNPTILTTTRRSFVTLHRKSQIHKAKVRAQVRIN